jgi:hypothetical protein
MQRVRFVGDDGLFSGLSWSRKASLPNTLESFIVVRDALRRMNATSVAKPISQPFRLIP